MSQTHPSPKYQMSVVGASDYSSLIDLAYAALSKDYDVAAELVGKLEKSLVVPDGQAPHDAVRIGSTVTFEVEGGSRRTIKLVYPDKIDVILARISVLTPIGVALLGLREGQCSQWFSRDGQAHHLTVVCVVQEAADLVL